MDVPSPIQEEASNGTPSSRGTGTTASSSASSSRRPGFSEASSRRPGVSEASSRRGVSSAGEGELASRFSPMGAGVRQSAMLLPVAEGSHEEEEANEQISQMAALQNVLSPTLPNLHINEPSQSHEPQIITSFDVRSFFEVGATSLYQLWYMLPTVQECQTNEHSSILVEVDEL